MFRACRISLAVKSSFCPLEARLERAGVSSKSAIAETRGGAWALARRGEVVIPEGGLLSQLGPMPVSALRIEAPVTEGLTRLGLHSIVDFTAVPGHHWRAGSAGNFFAVLIRRSVRRPRLSQPKRMRCISGCG